MFNAAHESIMTPPATCFSGGLTKVVRCRKTKNASLAFGCVIRATAPQNIAHSKNVGGGGRIVLFGSWQAQTDTGPENRNIIVTERI